MEYDLGGAEGGGRDCEAVFQMGSHAELYIRIGIFSYGILSYPKYLGYVSAKK
jgi:hypothetical protein